MYSRSSSHVSRSYQILLQPQKKSFKTFLLLLFTWTYIYNSTFEMNKDHQNLYETQTKKPESTLKVMLLG